MKIIIELNSFEEISKLKNWLNNYDSKCLNKANIINTGEKIDLYQQITVLDITIRTRNCLLAEGIKTLDDLMKWSVVGLLRTPNLGKKSVAEIQNELYKLGLCLKNNG